MFNYNNLGWENYRRSAQGYRVSDSQFTLYTSYNTLSYQLPTLSGNRGKDRRLSFKCKNCPWSTLVMLQNINTSALRTWYLKKNSISFNILSL